MGEISGQARRRRCQQFMLTAARRPSNGPGGLLVRAFSFFAARSRSFPMRMLSLAAFAVLALVVGTYDEDGMTLRPLHRTAVWGFGYIPAFPSVFWLGGLLLGAIIVALIALQVLRKRRPSGNQRRELPRTAEALLCIFARAKDIDALMGDFEELYARDTASGMSQSRAVVRYWARVLRSVGPLACRAIKRVGMVGLIAAAIRAISWGGPVTTPVSSGPNPEYSGPSTLPRPPAERLQGPSSRAPIL
jgi:hypothetical protein